MFHKFSAATTKARSPPMFSIADGVTPRSLATVGVAGGPESAGHRQCA
jgi:hypothetical protein